MFVYNSAVNKARSLKEGDMVSWNSSGGRAEGKVIRVTDSGSLDIPDSSFKIKGEKDNPAVLIQLYRDGKPTDRQVGHKMSALRKSVEFDFFKHGSHNQQSHAGSRGRGIGGSGAAAQKDPSEKYYDKGYDDALMDDLGEKLIDFQDEVDTTLEDLDDEFDESQGLDMGQLAQQGLRSSDRIDDQIKIVNRANQSVKDAMNRIDDAGRPVDTDALFNQHRSDVIEAQGALDEAITALGYGDDSIKGLIQPLKEIITPINDYLERLKD